MRTVLFLAVTGREHCIPVLGSVAVQEGLESQNKSYDFSSSGCLRDNMPLLVSFPYVQPSSSPHGDIEMTKKFKQR